jgi:hypothetical protein
MFKAIKEFFTGKPAEVVAEVPYKVEAVVDTADIAIAQLPDPRAIETVVVVPAAVVTAAVVEQAPAVKKPRAPKAPAVKKPRAPRVPKAAK